MLKNPYDPKAKAYTPLRMLGMSANSFLTDNKESFGKELRGSRSEVVSYQLGSIGFNMIRQPKISFNYRPFIEMGETEVTRELFVAVMGWDYSYNRSSIQNPVERVNWFDCIYFCNKLSNLLGFEECYKMTDVKMDDVHITQAEVKWDENKKGFRLPAEYEWDLYAKAGTGNRWAGTNDEGELGQYAWYGESSKGLTHPVSKKLPNAWGLYDMSGNVWEWCWNSGPEEEEGSHVMCGGSFLDGVNACLITSDFWSTADFEDLCRGFRLARSFG